MKVEEFVNRVDSDEAVDNEPPHLVLHCLSSCFLNFQYEIAGTKYLFKFCRCKFCCMLL